MPRAKTWRTAWVAILLVVAPAAWADLLRGGALEEPAVPGPATELSDVARLILQVRFVRCFDANGQPDRRADPRLAHRPLDRCSSLVREHARRQLATHYPRKVAQSGASRRGIALHAALFVRNDRLMIQAAQLIKLV